MACNRDTRVGCLRALPALPLGHLSQAPSPLSVPYSRLQVPWRSGRPSPSMPADTPARPAAPRAWPTSTWSSPCKVSIPQARHPWLLGQGSRWRARGFFGRKEIARPCPPFRRFRNPLFPLAASLSGAQTAPGWRGLGVNGVPRDLCSPVPLQPPPW